MVDPPGEGHLDLAGWWRRYRADFHARLYRGQAVVRLAPRAASSLTEVAAQALRRTMAW